MWAGMPVSAGSPGSGTGPPHTAVIGSSPAHSPSSASGLSPSSGGPVRILTDASSSDKASSRVAASSLRLGWRA